MLQIEIDGSAQFLAGALPFTLPTANLLTATCTPSRSLFLIRMHPDVRRDLARLRQLDHVRRRRIAAFQPRRDQRAAALVLDSRNRKKA